MNITFVLPPYARIPIGGYKIVFEYANRLVEKGHEVNIVFDNRVALKKYNIPLAIKRIVIEYFTQKEPRWFNIDSRVRKISSYDTHLNNKINKSDVLIATAATTISFAETICNEAKKFYFIQGYENWNLSEEELIESYRKPFKKIVISRWLKERVETVSQEKAIYVRNPLDVEKYKVLKPIEARETNVLGMLYHINEVKGCNYTLDALKMVYEQVKTIKVIMFGAYAPPNDLPEWVTYHQNATQEDTITIYNTISIFVSGSLVEGFGLTGLEAMACGAALITTNNEGALEYAKNGENSIVVEKKDVQGMAEAILCLMEENKARIRMAENGVVTAKEYSWDNAYKQFEEAIKS